MHALLVAPNLSQNARQALAGLLDTPGLRTGLITQAPVEALPSWARGRLTGHYRVIDALDADQLTVAVRAFQSDAGPVDRVIGFLEHVQAALGVVRERTGVPGMGAATSLNFRDKHRMKRTLHEAGLPVAQQAMVDGLPAVEAFAARVGWPVVLKPPSGVGSQGTRRVDGPAEAAVAVRALGIHAGRPSLAEEFVQGTERSFEAVLIDGQPVFQSSVHYVDRPLEILEHGWRQWCVYLPRAPLDAAGQAFAPINTAALRALGLRTGMAHMEWFQRRDGSPVISEVGARPPGASFMTMLSVAHEADVWAQWARVVTIGRFDVGPRRHAVGCAYLRGTGPGSHVSEVTGHDDVLRTLGPLVAEARIPTRGARRSTSYEGDGWIIVRADDDATVQAGLARVVRGVRVTYT